MHVDALRPPTPTAARRRLWQHARALFAAVTLATTLLATLLYWPVPRLEYTVDPDTGIVDGIDAGGPADRGGLRVGDQILRRYGYDWADRDRQLLRYPLPWGQVAEIPFTVQRGDDVLRLSLPIEPPAADFQAEKLVNLAIALLCWATGYILGVVRRHESFGTPLISWYWLAMGGALGSYLFAYYSSDPLTVALAWVMLSVLFPLSVYVHLFYPVRPALSASPRQARRALLAAIVLMQPLLAAVALLSPSVGELAATLHDLLMLAFVIGFISVGAILLRDERRERVAHVRRQMRLIMISSALAGATWLTLRVLPELGMYEIPIHSSWIDLVSGLIPLSYLLGGVTPDLYRIDRVLVRGARVLTTAALLLGLGLLITAPLGLGEIAALAWVSLGAVVLYGPASQLADRLTSAGGTRLPGHEGLRLAASRLATTLDGGQLVRYACDGVRQTFNDPPLGFYLLGASGELELIVAERLSLPATLDLSSDAEERLRGVLEQSSVAPFAGEVAPGIALWCPVRHSGGQLLGVLLLGMRGDLDPYRDEDLRELERFAATATLAFTNSATYAEQVASEQVIRQLYQSLQQAHDDAARAIAQEIHDDVLNVTIPQSITALQRIDRLCGDERIQGEVRACVDRLYGLSDVLRLICESLYPAGLDDPLALGAVLRRQVVSTERLWEVRARLTIVGEPIEVAPAVQREAMRIVKEALINAVKHAAPSAIQVELRYPERPGQSVTLQVSDNGSRGAVHERPGGLGLRNMRENALSAGGTIAFTQGEAGGHTVVFTFPSVPPRPAVSLWTPA